MGIDPTQVRQIRVLTILAGTRTAYRCRTMLLLSPALNKLLRNLDNGELRETLAKIPCETITVARLAALLTDEKRRKRDDEN